MQGQIKTIPLSEYYNIEKGMQVLLGDTILAKIMEIAPARSYCDYVLTYSDNIKIGADIDNLRLLVIEHREVVKEPEGFTINQILLQPELWRNAIDFGIVDTNTIINFDIDNGKVVLFPIPIGEKKKVDNFSYIFNTFIDERIKTASSFVSETAYKVVKEFVNKHYKSNL